MRRLVLLGVFVFVAGLIVLFPARVAYSLFAPEPLRLSGLDGTLWSATAREGEIAGLYLRDVEWRFRPSQLVLGRVAVDFSVSPGGGFLEGGVALSPGGTVRFSVLQGAVSIAAVQGLMPTPGIEGNVRLDMAGLTLENGFPTAADGSVEIIGLVARGLSPSPIGDFRAELTSGDDAVTGSIEDLGGALDVAASFRLSRDRNYELTGLVAATPQAPPAIVEQLRFLGSENERGQRPFRFEGQL